MFIFNSVCILQRISPLFIFIAGEIQRPYTNLLPLLPRYNCLANQEYLKPLRFTCFKITWSFYSRILLLRFHFLQQFYTICFRLFFFFTERRTLTSLNVRQRFFICASNTWLGIFFNKACSLPDDPLCKFTFIILHKQAFGDFCT